jgi:ABC-type sugar transport system ATPase subunit
MEMILHGVNLVLQPGTVHALMGENGAGKSTLMKVIAGVHSADSGVVLLDDKEVQIESPLKARELGIAMIHQELSSLLEMSIAENMYLSREPGKFGFVDYDKMYKDTREVLSRLGIDLDPKTKMKELRVADQQMVEIAKAISQDARVIIMDEPTSSITDKEVERLFEIIRGLKEEGVGIIYISHKMDEIFRICDEMTVLRDGTYIDTFKADEIDEDGLIRSMVGRDLGTQFPKTKVPITDTVLKVENLSRKGEYEDISFELHKGEILGLVGLVGAGRTELMHSIFGMTKPDSGKIELYGKEVSFKNPKEAINHGIAYVTEDRKGEGLILPMSVEKNITLVSLGDFVKGGFLQKGQEADVVKQQVDNLKIKVARTSQPVSSLSGGNQQKVVLAKWMITNPHILIFDEPTRGIDVGAKAEIYKIMCDYVSQGNSIIMVSSEMPEAMGMSDRIIVLSNHKVSGELDRSEFDEETIAQKQFAFMKDN